MPDGTDSGKSRGDRVALLDVKTAALAAELMNLSNLVTSLGYDTARADALLTEIAGPRATYEALAARGRCFR